MYLSRNGVTANTKLVGRLHAAPSGVRNGRRDECCLKLVRAGASPFGASVAEITAIGHWRLEERRVAAVLEKVQAQADVLVAADTGPSSSRSRAQG